MLRKVKKMYKFYRSSKLSIYFVNFIFQKLFRINSGMFFSVNFTSRVTSPNKLKVCGGDKTFQSFANSGGCYFGAFNGIILEKNVLFAPGVKIISSNHTLNDNRLPVDSLPVLIGSNVWLGANVIVLPGVKIGANSTIGAGSVVAKDIPANCIALGNPAKVIALICECGCKQKVFNIDNEVVCGCGKVLQDGVSNIRQQNNV